MTTIEVDSQLFYNNNNPVLNILIGLLNFINTSSVSIIKESDKNSMLDKCYKIFDSINYVVYYGYDKKFTRSNTSSNTLYYLSNASKLRDHFFQLNNMLERCVGEIEINLLNFNGSQDHYLKKYIEGVIKLNRLNSSGIKI